MAPCFYNRMMLIELPFGLWLDEIELTWPLNWERVFTNSVGYVTNL